MLRIDHTWRKGDDHPWNVSVFLDEEETAHPHTYELHDVVSDTAGHMFIVEDIFMMRYDSNGKVAPISVTVRPIDHRFMPTGAFRKPITY